MLSLPPLLFIVALGAADPAAASSTAPPSWTEADALSAWERGSQVLVDARAGEASARGEVEQAGLVPNPSLGLSVGNIPLRTNPAPIGNGPGPDRNLVGSVEIAQTFELGGKRSKRVAQARAAAEAAGAATADARRADGYEIRRAFWNAVRARERLALAEQVTRRSGETIRIGRARFESQDIAKTDLDKVELEAMKQLNDLADAVAVARSAVAELLARVGPEAPPAVVVSGDLAQRPVKVQAERLAARALERRPDVRAARARVDAARGAFALAEAQAIPDVTVGAGYTYSRAVAVGDNPATVSLNVSVPLPLFSRNQGEIQKTRVEAERTVRAAAALEARVAQEVAGALARYGAAAEKVERYDAGALQRADRALQVAEKTWRAGDRSLLEYLEAERTWIELRGDYLDTLFELRLAGFELERAVGEPLAEEKP